MDFNLPPHASGSLHLPSQAGGGGDGGSAFLPSSSFSPSAYYLPQAANQLVMGTTRDLPTTGGGSSVVDDNGNAAATTLATNAAASSAPPTVSPNNASGALLLASLAAQAQRAEAEAANAEMQYYLSKRKAAMAAARSATQNYRLLQLQQNLAAQEAAAQQKQAAQQQQQQQHDHHRISSAAASRSAAPFPTQAQQQQQQHVSSPAAASRLSTEQQRPDPVVSDAASTTSVRRVEIEAAGAFFGFAPQRAPSPLEQQQQQLAETATVSQQLRQQARVAAKEPYSAVTPDPSPKLSSQPQQLLRQLQGPLIVPPRPNSSAESPRIDEQETPPPTSRIHISTQQQATANNTEEKHKSAAKSCEGEGKKGKPKTGAATTKGAPPLDGDLPKRSYTAYNFFFAVEREKILSVVPPGGVSGDDRDTRINAVLSCLSTGLDRDMEEETEKRIAVKILREQCTTVGLSKAMARRKHRTSHGKVGFVDMTYIISRLWRALPEAKVNWYKDLGKMDLLRFQQAMNKYNDEKDRKSSI